MGESGGLVQPRAFVLRLPLLTPYPDQSMLWRSFRSVSPCLLKYMPVSLPCPPGCASSIAVFSYFILQRPYELCIILSVAVYMSTRLCWTTTELQVVPMRDTNRHTEATMLTMYINYTWSNLDRYLNTDCACDTVCS